MNLLIISQYFWPENFRINDLALGLMEKGHNVTVLTGIPNYPSGQFFHGYGPFKKRIEYYRGIRVLRVPLFPRGNGSPMRLAANYLSFALFASMLAPLRCRGKFDLIFVYEVSPITVGIPAIILKKIKRIPIFFWVLDLWPESLSAAGAIKSRQILYLVSCLVRLIYRQCDRILISSRDYMSSVEAMDGKPEQILYYPNWAESLFDMKNQELPRKIPEIHNIPEGFLIMFTGNVGVAQDFGTILGAAERLKDSKDIHWLILGDGRMYNWVKDQIRIRGLSGSVHLLGTYPLEDMPYFYSLADVMLVTLKRDPIFSLTVPGKIQSYLASGKPIIAVLDGAGGAIVKESGAGLSCASGDAEALAKTVNIMYRMPKKEREAMGESGRAYFNVHFERQMLIDRLENWMEYCRKGQGRQEKS